MEVPEGSVVKREQGLGLLFYFTRAMDPERGVNTLGTLSCLSGKWDCHTELAIELRFGVCISRYMVVSPPTQGSSTTLKMKRQEWGR